MAMGDTPKNLFIDYETYRTLEEASDTKHEWYDGVIYAMSGGTLAHGGLASRFIMALGALTSSCGCHVFTSDVKVRVLATGIATYPDVSVACGELQTDPADRTALTNPSLIVEVLSDATEAYDRGEKFAHYRQLPSLRDYVLVSQHEARIEVFSRDGERWMLTVAHAGERAPLTAFAGALDVDRVYEGVTLEPRAARGTEPSPGR